MGVHHVISFFNITIASRLLKTKAKMTVSLSREMSGKITSNVSSSSLLNAFLSKFL